MYALGGKRAWDLAQELGFNPKEWPIAAMKRGNKEYVKAVSLGTLEEFEFLHRQAIARGFTPGPKVIFGKDWADLCFPGYYVRPLEKEVLS